MVVWRFDCLLTMVESDIDIVNNHYNTKGPRIFLHSPPLARRNTKMGMSKDTSDIRKKDESIMPLKSCILLQKEGNSDEKIMVKKAKSVHFADTLGKPLKSVKTLLDTSDDEFGLSFLSLRSTTRKTFSVDIFKRENDRLGNVSNQRNKLLNFSQPVTSKDFQTRVETNNVCLENVVFRDYGIFATIAVKNIAYEKSVHVRYTFDDWLTCQTIDAAFVPGSSSGITDTFCFEIICRAGGSCNSIFQIQLAVCFTANGQDYWDSNHGKNYSISFSSKIESKKNLENHNGFILSKQNFIGWVT